MSLTRKLSTELIFQANENPKRIQEDILAIKEWLKKQSHLTCRSDDGWILNFLRGCKFSLERAKEKIDTHLTLKTLLPEFFSNRDPLRPELQDIFKAGIMVHLKNPDVHGRAIVLHRAGQTNTKKHSNTDVVKYAYLSFDTIFLEDVRSCTSGLVTVVDCKGLSTEFALHLNIASMRKAVTCQTGVYPFPSQPVYCIHCPSAFESVYNVFRSLSDNYKFYGNDLTEFYKDIPKSVLPKEYGGDAGPVDDLVAEWNEKVLSYRDWLIDDEKYRVDEKKRPGKTKTASDIFGMEGSFRALNLD